MSESRILCATSYISFSSITWLGEKRRGRNVTFENYLARNAFSKHALVNNFVQFKFNPSESFHPENLNWMGWGNGAHSFNIQLES